MTITFVVEPSLNGGMHTYKIAINQEPRRIDLIVDYEVDIDFNVIKSYFIWEIGEYTFKTWGQEKQNGFIRAIELAYDRDLFSSYVLDENENFLEFAREYFGEDMLNYLDENQDIMRNW